MSETAEPPPDIGPRLLPSHRGDLRGAARERRCCSRPADWQVARRWHQEGVPLDLVGARLEEVFAKRKERGAKGKISSLRYCAPAVEAAWADLRELTVPGTAWRPPTSRPPPPRRPRRRPAAGSRRLRRAGRPLPAGDPQEVEERLSALDREMLDHAASGRLDGELRAEVRGGGGEDPRHARRAPARRRAGELPRTAGPPDPRAGSWGCRCCRCSRRRRGGGR